MIILEEKERKGKTGNGIILVIHQNVAGPGHDVLKLNYKKMESKLNTKYPYGLGALHMCD